MPLSCKYYHSFSCRFPPSTWPSTPTSRSRTCKREEEDYDPIQVHLVIEFTKPLRLPGSSFSSDAHTHETFCYPPLEPHSLVPVTWLLEGIWLQPKKRDTLSPLLMCNESSPYIRMPSPLVSDLHNTFSLQVLPPPLGVVLLALLSCQWESDSPTVNVCS